MWFSWCMVSLCCLEVAVAARILGVFPTPSISHQVVFRELTLELARRGHELVVLTTDPTPHPHPNLTEIDAHNVSYPLWQEMFMSKIFEAERAGKRSPLNQYDAFMKLQSELFDAQLSLPEVQSLLQSSTEHFDLILVESFYRPTFAFGHKFNAPLIAVSSLAAVGYTYNSMGIPTHPLLYPDPMSTKVSSRLFARMYAVYCYLYKWYADMQNMSQYNELTQKYFGENVPSIPELESQTDLLILNVNPIWDGIKVTPPNVIYMWGTHLKPAKELPEDLKRYLDSASRGVVYMSLGSNMKSSELSAERRSVLIETFRRLPYEVLWKWEADELPGQPDNVRISKWLPQADLLRHPNVKVFITQGGLQSTDEALQAGVPLIGLPAFGDQEANVEKYVTHGVGVALDIKTLTVEQLEAAIKSVAQDGKYRAAVRRMSQLLADGDGSVARAAWWVEYVLRHGGARHLRSPAAGVSVADYFMLDVVAALALAAAAALALTLAALYTLYSRLIDIVHTYSACKSKIQ